MDFIIRPIKRNEIMLLTDFVYEAVFLPESEPRPPRTLIQNPQIWAYIDDFGNRPHDYCLVAESDHIIVGAVWVRGGCAYGAVAPEIPECAVSIYPQYRNLGIGTALMCEMLKLLKTNNYTKLSLSVDKNNYAVKLYRKVGFRILQERDHDFLMICEL